VELVTVADVPLKVTALFAAVVSKFVPTMVTAVSTVPPDGEKTRNSGRWITAARQNKQEKQGNQGDTFSVSVYYEHGGFPFLTGEG